LQSTKVKNLAKDEITQSIADFIFKEAKAELGKLRNLSVYLDTFGIFFYGRARLNKFRERIELVQKIRREGGKQLYTFVDAMSDEALEGRKEEVDRLLKIYDTYVEEKKQIRKANKSSKIELEERKKVSSGMETIHLIPSLWNETNTRDESSGTPSTGTVPIQAAGYEP